MTTRKTTPGKVGMMSTIDRTPSGAWRVRVQTGRRMRNGHIGAVSRTARTKEEAKAIGRRLEEQYAVQPLGEDSTVADLFERWFAHLEAKDRSPHTLVGYRSKYRTHIKPALGSRKLSAVGHERIDDLYRQLLRDGQSPTSVRQVHAVLRAAFRQAFRWGLVTVNPIDRTEPPSARPHAISPPAMPAVVDVIAKAGEKYGPDVACFIQLAAATGARRGELAALRWTDLDVEAKTLTVARAWVQTKGVSVERSTKTKSTRTMALDDGTLAVLAERRARAEAEAVRQHTTLRPDGFILSGQPDGREPWLPGRLSHAWERVRDDFGMKGVRLHDLRHTNGTALLAAGVDLATVAERLGHAGGGATTLKVYAHATRASDRKAADLLGGMLS